MSTVAVSCLNKTITERFCHGDLLYVWITKEGEQSSRREHAQKRKKTEETKTFFLTNFSNTLHTFMPAEEGERHNEWMVDTLCKASRIMNSYTCHMLLTDSWQLHFPPLSVFLLLFQSPNLQICFLFPPLTPPTIPPFPPLVSHPLYLSIHWIS